MIRKAIWIALPLMLGCGTPSEAPQGKDSAATPTDPTKHVIVHYEPGRFCGWPANNGLWAWGNEIVVGFSYNYYKESQTGHSHDPDKPRGIAMARSLDGGETWSLERPEALNLDPQPAPTACPGIDFTRPDQALRFRGEGFHVSDDRGKNWEGPYPLPDFGQIDIMPRTDYLVKGPDQAQIFLTATKPNGKEGRPFMAETRDGGKTIEFVSWIGPEPPGFSIMPSTVRLGEGHLLSAIRRFDKGLIEQGWVDVYSSGDDGKSWEWTSKVADNGGRAGNPASTVLLPDGRVVVTYGDRHPPMGIRARISSDQGKTWGEEIVLRDDARTWDLGYPRSVVRPDGRIVTIYYYTTQQHKEQHIAATIWDPPPME